MREQGRHENGGREYQEFFVAAAAAEAEDPRRHQGRARGGEQQVHRGGRHESRERGRDSDGGGKQGQPAHGQVKERESAAPAIHDFSGIHFQSFDV